MIKGTEYCAMTGLLSAHFPRISRGEYL